MTAPDEMFDPVTKPKHYTTNSGMEAIEVIEAFAKDNAHRAAALKYLLRAGKKNDTVEDLRKAIWWIEREISSRPIDTSLSYKYFENKILKPMEAKAREKYSKPIDLAFTHCEGCHSMVCETVGACMHKVDCPH